MLRSSPSSFLGEELAREIVGRVAVSRRENLKRGIGDGGME